MLKNLYQTGVLVLFAAFGNWKKLVAVAAALTVLSALGVQGPRQAESVVVSYQPPPSVLPVLEDDNPGLYGWYTEAALADFNHD